MKVLEQVGHQGDVEVFSIDRIPENAKKINKQFIARSERSGSIHGLYGDYDIYELDDSNFVIDAKTDCILNHCLERDLQDVTFEEAKVLPKKDHRHSVIPEGKYLFGIQQRFDPLAGLKKKVRD